MWYTQLSKVGRRLYTWVFKSLAVFFFMVSMGLWCRGLSLYINWRLGDVLGKDVVFRVSLDIISAIFLSVLWFITGAVFLFGVRYITPSKQARRFFIVLILFVISMQLFISRGNLFFLKLKYKC